MKLHAVALMCLMPLSAMALENPKAILGAGSSAAAPIYKQWSEQYQRSSGIFVTYNPLGSSAGATKITNREVDFGATDIAMSENDLQKNGLLLIPVAVTAITPIVNLPKVADGQLRLSGTVLAKVYLGEITRWRDPEIAQINPTVALPDMPITVIARSDGSGSTYNLADYLTKVSPTWASRLGVKAAIKWMSSVRTTDSSQKMATMVKTTPGSIGYIDYGYVVENTLTTVQMPSADGEYVVASAQSIKSALPKGEWNQGSGYDTLTNVRAKGAWPITMGTFALINRVVEDPEKTQKVLNFFVWAFVHGDKQVQQTSFVRLPNSVQAAAVKSLSTIRDKTGALIGMAAVGNIPKSN